MLGSTYRTSQHPIPEGSEHLTSHAFYPHECRPYLNLSVLTVRKLWGLESVSQSVSQSVSTNLIAVFKHVTYGQW